MKSSDRNLLAVFYCVMLGTYLCSIIVEPEFFFHVTSGNWIRSHGTLPAFDVWTAGGEARRQVPAGWLFDVLLSGIETAWGDGGIAVAKLVLCSATAGMLFWLYRTLSGQVFFGAVVATLTACGLLEQAPFGPELAGWPLFAALLLAAFRGRFGTVFALTVLFANVAPLDPGELRLRVYDFTFAFLLLSWVFFLLLAWGQRLPRIAKGILAAGCVASLGGLFVQPLQELALILVGAVLAISWRERNPDRPLVFAVEKLSRGLSRLPVAGVAWVFFCLIVVNSVNFYRFPVFTGLLPAREVDYIVERNLAEPLWHEREIRPYLIYRFSGPDGSPRRLLSFDARSGQSFDDIGAGLALVRRGTPAFAALSADSRFQLLNVAPEPSGPEDESRQLPQFWALFQRVIEPKPVL